MPQGKIWWTCRRISSIFSNNELSTATVHKFCSLLSKLKCLSGAVVSVRLYLWLAYNLMRQQLMSAAYKNLMHPNPQVIDEMHGWHDKMH